SASAGMFLIGTVTLRDFPGRIETFFARVAIDVPGTPATVEAVMLIAVFPFDATLPEFEIVSVTLPLALVPLTRDGPRAGVTVSESATNGAATVNGVLVAKVCVLPAESTTATIRK